MTETIYIYSGRPGGVPGLPAEVTKSRAKELGLSELLDECIKAKLYKSKRVSSSKSSEKES